MEAALDVINMDAKVAWSNVASKGKPLSLWYNQLSDEQISDLMLIYRHDFQLLGFDSSSPKS